MDDAQIAPNVQLAILFVCGYLLSRLIIKARLPERLISLIVRRHVGPHRLILYLVAVSATMSFFIPNAITAITLLPVLTMIQERWADQHPDARARIATVLALSVIYGANIGGTGSITGTPANGILVVYAAVKDIPDQSLLRFHGWLLWGVPLVAVLVLTAWGVICACLRLPGRLDGGIEPSHLPEASHPLQRLTLALTATYLVVAFALSALMQASTLRLEVLAATGVLGGVFVAFLFLGKHRVQGASEALLSLRDCYSNLPLRGLLFVGVFLVVVIVLAVLGAIEYVSHAMARALPGELDSFSALVAVAALTSFATEVFSNTVVQLAMFEILTARVDALESVIFALLAVTLSCTCAFMSPLATGVNGLVFGEMRGTSLARMLVTGTVMNLVAALVITLWVRNVVA